MSTANAYFILKQTKKYSNTNADNVEYFFESSSLPSFSKCIYNIVCWLGEEEKIAFDPLVCDLAIKSLSLIFI